MSRITKKITYNIAERGRQHTGQDRSNLDIGSMVNVINSNAVQELVRLGDLYGFYGHEIRQKYGLNPPDSIIDKETGKIIKIAPVVRTVELSADKNGNVTHRQEFLENDGGEYAYQQYKAKIGGFSSVVQFGPVRNGKVTTIGHFGFDYVRSANYVTNTTYGVFDGLVLDEKALAGFDSTGDTLTANALETAIIAQYDSIRMHAQAVGLVDHYQQEALTAQNALDQHINRELRKKERQRQRQQEIYDSLLCPSVSFDEYTKELAAFDAMAINDTHLTPKDETPRKPLFDENAGRNFFAKLMGRG